LFGDVIDGVMYLSEHGKIAEESLEKIPHHYDNIGVDIFVVMPNHVHLILRIKSAERINAFPTEVEAKVKDAPNVIGRYKAGVTRIAKKSVWQKSYHDHVIRNKKAYLEIYEYIEYNALKWEMDCHNPVSPKYKRWK